MECFTFYIISMSTFTDDNKSVIENLQNNDDPKMFPLSSHSNGGKKNVTKTRENGYVNFTFKRIKLFQIEKLKKKILYSPVFL